MNGTLFLSPHTHTLIPDLHFYELPDVSSLSDGGTGVERNDRRHEMLRGTRRRKRNPRTER